MARAMLICLVVTVVVLPLCMVAANMGVPTEIITVMAGIAGAVGGVIAAATE